MALRGTFSFTVILFFFLLVSSISCANDQRYLARGSSISTQDDTIAILVSPNGAFSCGFYKVATNTFTFSIWFSWSSEKTVAWTANRDAPVNGKGSKITFQKNGLYTFYFDSNNILTLIYNGPETSSIYWPNPDYRWWENGRTTYNSSQYGVLDQKGQFVASDQFEFQASDLGDEVMRRLTLDYDGNLRLYSLNTSSGHWSATWMAFQRVCEIHGVCGRNSLCTYIPKLGCSCLKGFEMIEPSDWTKGCRRNVNLTSKWNWSKEGSGKTNNTDSKQFSFRKLCGIDFWGYDFNFTEAVPLWKCKKMCLEKQDCQAFAYRKGEGKCYPKVLLINGKNFTHPYNDIYLKVPEVTVSLAEMSPGLTRGVEACDDSPIHQSLDTASGWPDTLDAAETGPSAARSRTRRHTDRRQVCSVTAEAAGEAKDRGRDDVPATRCAARVPVGTLKRSQPRQEGNREEEGAARLGVRGRGGELRRSCTGKLQTTAASPDGKVGGCQAKEDNSAKL
ncbi:hypothetical protein PR202_ga18049 [Eleusine coracana subsp. coracana]|uniref:non-specific serine/threonine protein kinase n=1 Tax=Eleusine coracana subsp. coracana TaxID=191504 RepID=A0AAV5CS18_ELECO|nr:hypothetical protein PR202_ga18049 [Eleusine coracana subsp. coracana]